VRKCKSGWDRSLGTSKRKQGIRTPKAPQNITGHFTIRGSQLPKESGLAEFIAKLIRKET